MKTIKKLWIFMAVLAILTPIGLMIPQHFKAGAAWGEWGTEEMQKLVGYIPQGLARLSSLWNAPMPDYVLKACEKNSGVSYIISAIAGILATAGIVYLIGKILIKRGRF